MLTALLLTLAVGALWAFVGVFYKLMAKWNLSPFSLGLVNCPVTLILMALFYTKTGALMTGTIERPDLFYMLFVFAAGAFNSAGCLILQRSMTHGKSSVCWAIGQSAMVVAFLSITLICSEPWNLIKVTGTLIILCGMIVISRKPGAEDETIPRARYGLLLAFISFLVLGVAQSMTSGASYFTYKDPGNVRPLITTVASLCVTASGKWILKDRGFHIDKHAWFLIIVTLIQNTIATCLSFVAMDKLTEYQMNGVFFPTALGTCIGGYTIISAVFFKEKMTKHLLTGTALILGGILCFCLTAWLTFLHGN